MAFKGTKYVKEKGKRRKLVADFCTSDHNLNRSRWTKPHFEQTSVQLQITYLREVFDFEVQGINLVLIWDTESDIRPNVLCGCK
jgi:hypothetical protein